ncbi:MAG TPA: hypothetical protein VI589_08895 [Vicinamibacteria bacterium]
MKLIPNRTSLVLVSAALAFAARPASAQVLQHDRGTILNIDTQSRQIEIKDAKDRERIWPYAADATVKFSDKAWQNRGSALKDLRVGMYVHFAYSSGSSAANEVIQEFDVKDIGKSGGGSGATNPEPPPPAGMTAGRVTAVDMNVAQVEVLLDRGGRKTYQATNARVLTGLKAGDRIGMRLERDANGQEIVVQAERLR